MNPHLLTVLTLIPSTAVAQATFSGLGHLGPSVSYSQGYGVSADGATAVGSSLMSGGIGGISAPFAWTQPSGMYDVYGNGAASSTAAAASASGSAIVGWADFGAFSPLGVQAFINNGNGVQLLGDFASNPNGVPRSFARAVNADGNVLVGDGLSSHGTEAFIYRVSIGERTGLGALSPTNFSSWAYGVSGKGSIVVGASYSAANELQAFRWTSAGGMVGLGFLASPTTLARWSRAEAISADGSTIIGECRSNNSQNGLEAFRWTQAGGMVGLGDLSGGSFQSFAYACSADGSVIVGMATIDGPVGPFGGGSAPRAFIWDQQHGIRDLQDLLLTEGAPIAGWKLTEARGLSADGRTIVGTGTDPNGNTQAWIATLPATACYANCDTSSVPPILNINDFQCFTNRFAAADPYANCDGSTSPPTLNVNDFQCFLNRFAAGCT